MSHRDKRVVGLAILLATLGGGYGFLYLIGYGVTAYDAAASAVAISIFVFLVCFYTFAKRPRWFHKTDERTADESPSASASQREHEQGKFELKFGLISLLVFIATAAIQMIPIALLLLIVCVVFILSGLYHLIRTRAQLRLEKEALES